MRYESASQNSNYVLDASSLIQIEGIKGKGLKTMPDFLGKWLIVPSKVAKEVNSKTAPKETKKWIKNGKTASFNSEDEKKLYMTLRVEEKALHDPDIEGIVIAYHRKCIYVVEEGPAKAVAKKLGINVMNYKEFMDRVRPRLL